MCIQTSSNARIDQAGQLFARHRAAAPLLALPKLSHLPKAIPEREFQPDLIDVLARLNRYLPASPESNPFETIRRMLNQWAVPLLKHVEKNYEICLGIAIGSAAEEMLPETNDVPKNLLYCCFDNYYDDEQALGSVLETMEAENPGLGQQILRVLERSPFQIGTPAYCIELASYCYWLGEDNEAAILEEYRSECSSEEEYENSIDEYVPVRYRSFLDAMPEWAFNPATRSKEPYCGPLPEPLKQLKKLDKIRSRNGKQINTAVYPPSYPFPGFPMTWNKAHHSLMTQAIDCQYNMCCQAGEEAWFAPVFLSLDEPDQTGVTLQYAESAMRYLDACIELLDWLKNRRR